MFSKSVGMRRRGSVLILVIGVLAMLFVLGATQLMVARSERKLVTEKALRTDALDASQSSVLPPAATATEDVKGIDSLVYNRGWNAAETSIVEDGSDFLGVATTGNPNQLRIRSGDLILSSLEPYFVTGSGWQYYYLSWKVDAPTALSGFPAGTPAWVAPWPQGAPRLNHDYADADGDGIADSQWIGVIADCDVYQRVLPHGGMVLLDRLTHPALLAQVIHPADGTLHLQPWDLFNPNGLNWSASEGEEARLRRRFMLPGSQTPSNLADWNALPTNDLRKVLPVTLGHKSADTTYDNVTPHWYRVATPGTDLQTEQDWFKARMTPGVPLTIATSTQKNSDMYDRRHVMTTRSNDDLLRPDRDEKGLLTTPTNVRNEILSPAATLGIDPPSLYYVLNPDSTAITDGYGLDTWGRDLTSAAQVPMGYGINANSGAFALEFNKPGLRTQFSLRDVLVAPVTTGGYQASYRRAIQLTAFYLDMLRHQVTSSTVPATPPGSLPSDEILLRQAAQLAVNTIDFADNNDLNNDRTQQALETDYPSRLHLTYAVTGGTIDIDVVGMEKQPYITEAYAKVAAVYDEAVPPQKKAKESDDMSVFAVEIYNPYRTNLDLTGVVLRTAGVDYHIDDILIATTRANAFMNPGEVLIFANTNLDPTAASVANPPFDGSSPANLILVSGLKILDTEPVQLLQTKVVRLDPPSTALAYNGDSVLETLPTSGAGVTAIILDEMGKSTPGTYNLFQSENPDVAAAVNASKMVLSGDNFAKPLEVASPAKGATYWQHTSLQRRKEDLSGHPIAWHFTMARQAGFASANTSTTGAEEPPIHGLKSASATRWGYLFENDLAQGCGSATCTAAPNNFPDTALRFQDIPPIMVTTSDLGFDWTTTNLAANPPRVGTAAFPTTGSLLLVSREGHKSFNGNVSVNLGEKAANYFEVKTADLVNFKTVTAVGFGKGIDFGHMPVFDIRRNIPTVPLTDPNYALYTATRDLMTAEVTSDLAEERGRLDVPWGQLVFHYFTALPLEELTHPTYTAAASMYAFENVYMQDFGLALAGPPVQYVFSYYPFVEPVTEAASRLGPRVRGRVNVNLAPWWVLDGLPALRGDYMPTAVLDKPVFGLPVAEILCGTAANYLDPDPSSATTAGRDLQDLLMDGQYFPAGPVDRTISPVLAQYLVSYRERRELDELGGMQYPASSWTSAWPANPGYTTLGTICDAIAQIPARPKYLNQYLAPNPVPYCMIRSYADPTQPSPTRSTKKPFSYVGYPQMIAPVVRLEDWATVKSHVYTVYNLVGDSNGTWLRSQTTMDRTRCLYSNDLPERIVQTEPMDYFNTISDQQ